MAENDETRLTPEQRQTAIELIESAQRKWTTVKDGKIIPSKELNKDSSAPVMKQNVSKDGIPYDDNFAIFAIFAINDLNKLSIFNTDLLPEPIMKFSKAVTESLQVSPGMVSPAMLSIGSLGTQGKYNIHPLPDWYEPSNLYIAIVAEASERKSPAMKEIMEPVYCFEKEENEKLAPDIARYQTKKKILEGQISNITKSLTSVKKKPNSNDKYLDMGDLESLQEELNNLEEVAPVRIAVDDITMEVLAKVMQQNKERIGIVSTEGGIFNILAGRYSSNEVIDLVLKGYSGDRYTLDRVTRNGQELEHPLITALLYVQPIVISDIMENSEFVGCGLNARFLYSIPPSTLGKRRYEVSKIDDETRKDYADIIARLFAIPVPDKPKTIELDEDAYSLAEKFFYEIDRDLINTSPEFRAWLGKLHGTTMRIALVLHCFEYVEDSENHKISGKTMADAIEIGRYFREHAEAAFNIMGLLDPQEVRDAKYIMGRIDSSGLTMLTIKQLIDLCNGKKGLSNREDLIPGIKCLIEHGYIRVQKSQKSQKGRPSETIYVNPEYTRLRMQEIKGRNK